MICFSLPFRVHWHICLDNGDEFNTRISPLPLYPDNTSTATTSVTFPTAHDTQRLVVVVVVVVVVEEVVVVVVVVLVVVVVVVVVGASIRNK